MDKLALGEGLHSVLWFSLVSVNPPMLNTHLFTCHQW